MSDSGASEKVAWVSRVLGVTLRTPLGNQASESFTARLGAMRKAADTVARSLGRQAAQGLLLAVSEAEVMARQGNADAARMLLARADGLLRDGINRQSVAKWQAARKIALNNLANLTAAVSRSEAPERDAAVHLLSGISVNLPETPADLAAVAQIETYLNTDAIVAASERPNVFAVTVAIRQPLLGALAGLRKTMTALQGVA